MQTENSVTKWPKDAFGSFLKEQYELRKTKNKAYSLRAYAKFLGIDQSVLTKYINGKRVLNHELVDRCLERLGASDKVVERVQRRRFYSQSNYREVNEEVLELISGWQYWAILEYLKIDASVNLELLAERFGFTEATTKKLIANLVKYEFIAEEDGEFKLLSPNNSWQHSSKTSDARRHLQGELLKLSLEKLESVPIEFRHHASLTVSVNKNSLPRLKEKLHDFCRDFGDQCQKEDLTDVYQLTLSFFPLTRSDK